MAAEEPKTVEGYPATNWPSDPMAVNAGFLERSQMLPAYGERGTLPNEPQGLDTTLSIGIGNAPWTNLERWHRLHSERGIVSDAPGRGPVRIRAGECMSRQGLRRDAGRGCQTLQDFRAGLMDKERNRIEASVLRQEFLWAKTVNAGCPGQP
jgi:hypothetical protein